MEPVYLSVAWMTWKCAAGAKHVPPESKRKAVRNRIREWQPSNGRNNHHSSPLLKPLSYCDTQRNYSAETRSATYPSHSTMQHAATPPQLPLSWNCCQRMSTSSGADADSSAVRTMNAVLQRRQKHCKTSTTFKQQNEEFLLCQSYKHRRMLEQVIKTVCVKDANSCGISDRWSNMRRMCREMLESHEFGWICAFHTRLLIKPMLICLYRHKATKHD